ncbi:MAG: helix-turn-helix transcriptional regulator [Mucilaginibacter sp.]|jgi:AraC-like DNA-binding protein|nr:helix-turn-helix transcriptional regulator [Mucilaginibacter sp.]
MEYSRILENKNKITSTTLNQKTYTETTGNFSIRFIFSGNETCSIGRRQLSVHSDSFIILNKGTRFTSNSDPRFPVNVFSIEFDDDFLNVFNSNFLKGNKAILFDPDNSAYQLRETIYPFKGDIKLNICGLKNLLDNEPIDDGLINEYLHRCLFNCYRVYNEEIFQKAKKLNFLHFSTRIEILRRLNLAKEYLYANYNTNVNLESLANYACLSVNHLLRTFKLAYNQSPHQFLIQLRLQRAQLLLTKTEYPVYEIVNMVGFKCTSSFIRLFRTRYKTTPLKYRNVIV